MLVPRCFGSLERLVGVRCKVFDTFLRAGGGGGSGGWGRWGVGALGGGGAGGWWVGGILKEGGKGWEVF